MHEIPNNSSKTLFLNAFIRDLKISYIQQPILRLINYILEQILPSLTPSKSPS